MKKLILISIILFFSVTAGAKNILHDRMSLEEIRELIPYLYEDIERLKSQVSKLENNKPTAVATQNRVIENIPIVKEKLNPYFVINSDTVFSYNTMNNNAKFTRNIFQKDDKIHLTEFFSRPNTNWLRIGRDEYIESRYVTKIGN